MTQKVITITKSEYKRRVSNMKEGIANDLVNALIRRCPVDKGSLRLSIHYVIKGATIEIRMLYYGLHVEMGTQPHVIRPKNAKALAFKIGNETIFVKQVNHPGTRPQPFIRNTAHLDLPAIINTNVKRHLLAQ